MLTIPSRISIAQLIECLLGKIVVFSGYEGDATPFTDITVEDISKRLHAMGYQRHGNEALYQKRMTFERKNICYKQYDENNFESY